MVMETRGAMLADLESRFGRGEGVFFSLEQGDLVNANLCAPSGATARVLLNGGQVVSWRPAGGEEALFTSSRAVFAPGKAVRGGVPIVFPQFGSGLLVNHGFARTSPWTVVGSSADETGVALTLSLSDTAATRAVWPHRFRVDLTIALRAGLTLELWIENTDDHPWECTYLLHSYLAVADAAAAVIGGLHGLEFIDKTRGGVSGFETREEVGFDRWVDRVYRDAPDSVELLDRAGGRSVSVTRDNFRDIVVWNPWSEGSAALADLGPDDYTRFVCVESGNVAVPVVIPAGERVVSAQTIVITPHVG